MHIDTALFWNIQNCLGQDQAVGNHHHNIRLQVGENLLLFRIFQGLGLVDRQVLGNCQLLDRACAKFFAPARRAIRLGIDSDNRMLRAVYQGLQVCRSKVRRSCEDNSQAEIVLCSLAVDFFQLLANTLALKGGEVIHKQLALEVVDLVLDTNG